MEARHRPTKAVLAAVANAVPFIVLPIALLRTLPTLLPPDLPLEDLPLDLVALERTILLLGGLVVALAAGTAFFAKGLPGRAAFGAGRQGGRLAWIYYVLNGGVFALDAGDLAFAVDFQRLLYLLYASILLMAAYFVAEFLVYRKYFRPEAFGPAFYEGA